MGEGSSLKRKRWQRKEFGASRRNRIIIIWENRVGFPSLSFSKLYLIVWSKNLTVDLNAQMQKTNSGS